VPFIGCDGLAEEAERGSPEGELAATWILPPTTPAALEVLAGYWETGKRADTVRLEVASFPAIEALRGALTAIAGLLYPGRGVASLRRGHLQEPALQGGERAQPVVAPLGLQ